MYSWLFRTDHASSHLGRASAGTASTSLQDIDKLERELDRLLAVESRVALCLVRSVKVIVGQTTRATDALGDVVLTRHLADMKQG